MRGGGAIDSAWLSTGHHRCRSSLLPLPNVPRICLTRCRVLLREFEGEEEEEEEEEGAVWRKAFPMMEPTTAAQFGHLFRLQT